MKTYQLLRNNKSMGFYTKTCLLQIGLEPMDLLWVDGESITWKYPSELEEFSSCVSAPEWSEATVVNSRKERQIRYFDSHMPVLEYKKVNIQYIQEPDAFVNDINPGFEYLLLAQRSGGVVTGLENEILAEMEAGQRAVDAAKAIVNPANRVFGEGLGADVPEYQVNVDENTSFWKPQNIGKKQMKTRKLQQKRHAMTRSLGAMMMGITALAAALLQIKI